MPQVFLSTKPYSWVYMNILLEVPQCLLYALRPQCSPLRPQCPIAFSLCSHIFAALPINVGSPFYDWKLIYLLIYIFFMDKCIYSLQIFLRSRSYYGLSVIFGGPSEKISWPISLDEFWIFDIPQVCGQTLNSHKK